MVLTGRQRTNIEDWANETQGLVIDLLEYLGQGNYQAVYDNALAARQRMQNIRNTMMLEKRIDIRVEDH